MKPMLARTLDLAKFSSYPCYVQPKLNGVRALYQNYILQSRDEKFWSCHVLKHIFDDLARLHPLLDDYLLDGELYHHGWSLQRINSAVAVNRKEPTSDTPSIEYHVFDLVHSAPFNSRWLAVGNALRLSDLKYVKIVTTDYARNKSEFLRHFRRYVSLGYEGAMVRTDGPYEPGKRSAHLHKYKNFQDGEFLCVGATLGEGKASIGIGALVLKTITGDTFKVGTGFDDELRIKFRGEPPIGHYVKIRYLELTDGGIPFNPSFLCVL